jgi:glycosyltransferase involved in cell wall biosynthesis
MTQPLLTVLICTHDRVALLGQLLDSLDQAARPADGVELLVVANRCSDGTHALLEARVAAPAGRLPLRWVAEPTPGKSHALNRGMPEVRTPLVAFIDDDQRIDADFLQAACDAARDFAAADLFCGRLLPDWDGSEPRWVHDQGRYRIYPLPTPNFDPGPAPKVLVAGGPLPGGGNIIARTPWLQKVGPFAIDLGPVGHDLGGAEDADWLHRALKLRATLQYVPALLQYHYVDAERLTVSYLMRKAYKRSAASIGLNAPGRAAGVPGYAWRKLVGYALSALTAPGSARRRFYLIRSAAAAGEIAGYRGLAQSRPGHEGRPA